MPERVLSFPSMKPPDVSHGCQRALLGNKFYCMVTPVRGREGRPKHWKAARWRFKTEKLFRLLFNLRKKKNLLLQLWMWTVLRWLLRLEESSIIIGLVNPWPVPFQHRWRTSHPMQMASRTISSNHWLPHEMRKIIFATALADYHRPNASDSNMYSCFKLNCSFVNVGKKKKKRSKYFLLHYSRNVKIKKGGSLKVVQTTRCYKE